jgi:hypothetical protein
LLAADGTHTHPPPSLLYFLLLLLFLSLNLISSTS